jgi:hypothetical protein
MVSLMHLGNIYWEDEMPDYSDMAKLSEGERNTRPRMWLGLLARHVRAADMQRRLNPWDLASLVCY